MPKILVAFVIVAAVLGAYLVYGRRPSARPAAAPVVDDAAQATTGPARALGGPGSTVEVPPLAESDAFVRQLVTKLSAHPTVAAWLASDDLVRSFTSVVLNIAEGRTPAPQLTRLRPSSSFRVVNRGAGLFIDPRSYDRYTSIADAVASVDAAGAASLYTTLKPRIQEAYAELGFPGASFDPVLERALGILIATPMPRDAVQLEAHGLGYRFADPKTETLTSAQKQLLRFGPRNVRVIQDALRKIATALGVPEDHLPPSTS